MKREAFILCLFTLCIALFSCGPMKHRTYEYTISGYVYADRKTHKPLTNIGVSITDSRYSDYTYGECVDRNDYLVKTDENGYFSLKLNSSKIYTDIATGWFFDTRGDSMLTDSALVAKHKRSRYLGTDSCFIEAREFTCGARGEKIDELQDIEIYLEEYPSLVIEPKVFTRKQKVKMINNNGLRYISVYFLENTSRKDSISPFGEVYSVSHHPSLVYTEPLEIQLDIPDSVPAGHYLFRVFGSDGYHSLNMEPECIVELIDE